MQRNQYITATIKQYKHRDRQSIGVSLREMRPPQNLAQIPSYEIDLYATLSFLYVIGDPKRHKLSCLKRLRKEADTYARWMREYQAFRRAWPHACETCGASGMVHDAGDFYQPPMDEPCDDCIGKGKCPRCGAIIFGEDDEGTDCPICGWTMGHAERHIVASETMPSDCPVEFYCGCREPWE